ncbi:MAG TPA: YitT family protein [Syntrophomonadaceae bacterium]|nr:YitT family protein [Syntrophomonadaceae bacterium]
MKKKAGYSLKPTFLEKIKLMDITYILVGSFLLAGAIQTILVPARMLTGGVTGIAVILNYFTGWDIGLWYAILNIPIFVAGYRYVSRRFVLYSLIGAAALSAFLTLLRTVQFTLTDPLLIAVFGGALAGIGSGIIFRAKGSTGGIDIIAVLIKRYWGLNIGQTTFISNLLVIGLSLFSTNINLTLYSTIAIFVSSQVMDEVLTGLQLTRTVMIISHQHQKIAEAIIESLQRGCTFLQGQGGYTGDSHLIILVTVGQTQFPRLKELVFQIDPCAFIIVNESIEVFGQGFLGAGADF